MNKELNEKFPKTKLFEVWDSTSTPHPYCIGSKHVAYASDKHMGRLGKEAIKELEDKRGPCCEVRGCNLRYEEHEPILFIYCRSENTEELKKYLDSINEQVEAEGYVGYSLIDGFSKENTNE